MFDPFLNREQESNVRLDDCISQSDAPKSSQPIKRNDTTEFVFTAALVLVSGVVLRRCSDRYWLCHMVLLYAPVS